MVVVNENFNVDQAGEIGRNVLKLMVNFHLSQVGHFLAWQQNLKSQLNMKKYLLTKIYYFSVSLQLKKTVRSVWKIYLSLN